MVDLSTSSAYSLVRRAVLATTVVDFATTANTLTTWLVGTGQGVNCVGLALDFCAGLFSGLQASAFDQPRGLWRRSCTVSPSDNPSTIWSQIAFCRHSVLQKLHVFASSLIDMRKSSKDSPGCCLRY